MYLLSVPTESEKPSVGGGDDHCRLQCEACKCSTTPVATSSKNIVYLVFVLQGYDFSSQSASHYSLLEVGRHSSALDIRRSYKRLIKIHHPDKNLDGGDVVFQRVKLAYDVRSTLARCNKRRLLEMLTMTYLRLCLCAGSHGRGAS